MFSTGAIDFLDNFYAAKDRLLFLAKVSSGIPVLLLGIRIRLASISAPGEQNRTL
ncbi:hypothetical protein RISK_000290 [Rhodopirellula islandica]|uniref:Uncharacterized protein n=1 Tax=Rhodopirellula islandica TaxID=595434 RepID=A0A0J1EQA8_RHOIS|nr:hypothetical protein RISK_000290 [Rhodopirellula islandica]